MPETTTQPFNGENTRLHTPVILRGQPVTEAILDILNPTSTTNDNDEDHSAKRAKYIKMTPDQLSQLSNTCSNQILQTLTPMGRSPTSIVSNTTVNPAYYNNAKYEEICCRAMKPLYDGSKEELMPFFTRLDIRRQDEGWAPATYVTTDDKTYNLTYKFAHVTEQMVTTIATTRWSAPTVHEDKHTITHTTCQSRLLAKRLLASLTSSIAFTIINRIPQQFQNDGTFVLWALTNNVHWNNIAFVEHVREKITTATLANHQNDVERYLIYIQNNLRMINNTTDSTQHNGLVTYILHQLKQASNPLFLRYIQDLHIQYQEAKLVNFTTQKLIQTIEDKIRVLKHAEVWSPVTQESTPAMALATAPQLSSQLRELITKHISSELEKLQARPGGQEGKQRIKFQHQDWMFLALKHPDEVKHMNGRDYRWCAKCNKEKGQWVQAHTTDTHLDDFKPSGCRFKQPSTNGILKGGNKTTGDGRARTGTEKVAFATPDKTQDDTEPSTQLSLQDGLINCFRFDVPDVADGE
jgi:hypothetical protein